METLDSLRDVSPGHTFKLATKSAVSNSVNWDIWSTIVAIFGFVDEAAASVDCHLLGCLKLCLRLCWIAELVEESRRH